MDDQDQVQQDLDSAAAAHQLELEARQWEEHRRINAEYRQWLIDEGIIRDPNRHKPQLENTYGN